MTIDKKKCYPIDADGNMIEYVGYYMVAHEWLPMESFTAELSFQWYEKGRSSLRFILRDVVTDRTYSMMAQSIDTFVASSVKGKLKGKWKAVKRGANYGLILEEVL